MYLIRDSFGQLRRKRCPMCVGEMSWSEGARAAGRAKGKNKGERRGKERDSKFYWNGTGQLQEVTGWKGFRRKGPETAACRLLPLQQPQCDALRDMSRHRGNRHDGGCVWSHERSRMRLWRKTRAGPSPAQQWLDAVAFETMDSCHMGRHRAVRHRVKSPMASTLRQRSIRWVPWRCGVSHPSIGSGPHRCRRREQRAGRPAAVCM